MALQFLGFGSKGVSVPEISINIRFPKNKSCSLSCPGNIQFRQLFDQLVTLAMIPYFYKSRSDKVTIQYIKNKQLKESTVYEISRKKISDLFYDQKSGQLKISFPYKELRQDQAGIYGITIQEIIPPPVQHSPKQFEFEGSIQTNPIYKRGIMIGQDSIEQNLPNSINVKMEEQQSQQPQEKNDQQVDEIDKQIQQLKRKKQQKIKKETKKRQQNQPRNIQSIKTEVSSLYAQQNKRAKMEEEQRRALQIQIRAKVQKQFRRKQQQALYFQKYGKKQR